ncbi:MAG: hypothetical protein K8T10_15995 [Candidatus Eremiobacteraeota bacterium]|nr:hypothetical protein [Candidatus Eremiobacteraeota bacterium]
MNSDFLKIFAPLLDKKEVVPTVSSTDLVGRPADIENMFKRTNLTYYPLHKPDDLENKINKKVKPDHRAVFGYITSPYGYGKTSVLSHLWQKLEERGFLVTPPFTFSDHRDIIHALYGWCKYKIASINIEHLDEIENHYQYLTDKSLKKKAELIALKEGVSKGDATKVVESLYKGGDLLLTINESELVEFIEKASKIAIDAGFKGLILLLDEIQQFIYPKEKQTMKNLTKLFDFWSRMSIRRLPVGIIMSMPSHTEAGVREKRKDILDRFLEDGIHSNLLTLYDHGTPQILWDNIIKKLGAEEYRDIIDRETLNSLGQIAFKEHLGDGPRTVTEVFKRVIRYYQKNQSPYKPIQLIDDFVKKEITYEGAKGKVAQAVNNVLSLPDIRNESEHNAIKLLAAFPRGVKDEVAEKYGMSKAVDKVINKLLGRAVIYNLEGHTLGSLIKSEGPANIINEMLSGFLRHYQEEFENNVTEVIDSFAKYIIPQLFESKASHTLEKWNPFGMTGQRESLFALSTGTFSPEYPNRSVFIACTSNIVPPMASVKKRDIHYFFIFEFDGTRRFDITEPGEILIEDDLITIKINPDYVIGDEIPRPLMKLKEFVRPKKVTIMFILLLRRYLERWESGSGDRSLTKHQKDEIKAVLIDPLDKHIKEGIFSRTQSVEGHSISTIGVSRLKDVFERISRKRWPNYSTMICRTSYKNDIKLMRRVLESSIKLRQKRGNEAIEDEKLSIAKVFGYNSTATFENSIGTYLGKYIRKVKWEGKFGKVLLTLHPLEVLILEKIQGEERIIDGKKTMAISDHTLANACMKEGYLEEEIVEALRLLCSRVMIGIREEDKLIYLLQADVPLKESLENQYDELINRLEILYSFTGEKQIKRNVESANQMLQQIHIRLGSCDEDDDEERDEIDFELKRVENTLEHIRTLLLDGLKCRIDRLKLCADTYIYKPNSIIIQLDKEIKSSVLSFGQNLVSIRIKLKKKFEKNREQIEEKKRVISRLLMNSSKITDEDLSEIEIKIDELEKSLSRLVEDQEKTLSAHNKGYTEWRHILEIGSNLFRQLSEFQMDDLSKRITEEICPEISQMFSLRKLEGLKQHKLWKEKFDRIKDEKESRHNEAQGIFNEDNEKYSQLLRKLKVEISRIGTTFNYSDPDKSGKNRITEVYEKVSIRIGQIKINISELENDIIKAENFQNLEADEQKHLLKKSKQEYNDLKKQTEKNIQAFTENLIGDYEQFKFWVDRISELPDKVNSLRDQIISRLLIPGKATEEEKIFLKSIESKHKEDFSKIALELKKDRNMELGEMFSLLKDLFSKNLVNIQVQRRR